MYNVANAQDFQRLEQEAAERQLTKATFVTKMIECESRAAEKTRAFYIHVFLPWAKEQHAPTDPMAWFLASRSDSRENLLLSHVDKRGAYWRYYEHQYDSMLLNSLVDKGENEKAIELAAKMQREATTSEEKVTVYCGRSRAYLKKGDYDSAIADFSEAIRLDPKSAEAYYGRGYAYARKGDKAKAEEDFAQAKKLGYKEK